MSYHSDKWIHECSQRTSVHFPSLWNEILHAPSAWTYHLFKDNIFKVNDIILRSFFKQGKSEINQTWKYSNIIHAYCYVNHSNCITGRRSVTSISHLSNVAIGDWCYRKQTETSRISSNNDTAEMYTVLVDKKWIIAFCRSIGYPIGSQSKIY